MPLSVSVPGWILHAYAGDMHGIRMQHAGVELDAQEVQVLLHLVRSRHMEVDRMISQMEEGEGMDLQRHSALKTMRPQAEVLETLALKLEGAAKELERSRR